jgi:regulator of cell morphogenesis and NO signaling
MQQETAIDPTWSVNEVMARYPATLTVFNRYGVDTCCGGGAPVREAARRDGADVAALLDALRVAIMGDA